jgi:hypothetical protein
MHALPDGRWDLSQFENPGDWVPEFRSFASVLGVSELMSALRRSGVQMDDIVARGGPSVDPSPSAEADEVIRPEPGPSSSVPPPSVELRMGEAEAPSSQVVDDGSLVLKAGEVQVVPPVRVRSRSSRLF